MGKTLTAPELVPEDLLVLDDDRFSPDTVALVTGAASGIGRATAVALACNGLTVIGADIDDDGLAATADRAASFDAPGRVKPVETDLTDDDEVAAVVDAAAEAGTLRYVANIAGAQHIDFDAIPDHCKATAPELVVGSVDINDGVFRTFTNEAVTVDAVLASAAVPNLFRAVEIDGHRYWDGIFSQNPPIKDLMYQPPSRKPDELWIVQVNRQTLDGEPRTIDEIDDRRNELAGNISLNQELRFIEQVSEWVERGHLPAERFSTPAIHRLEIPKRYHCATKIDRTPAFLDELMQLGRNRARTFLETER